MVAVTKPHHRLQVEPNTMREINRAYLGELLNKRNKRIIINLMCIVLFRLLEYVKIA